MALSYGLLLWFRCPAHAFVTHRSRSKFRVWVKVEHLAESQPSSLVVFPGLQHTAHHHVYWIVTGFVAQVKHDDYCRPRGGCLSKGRPGNVRGCSPAPINLGRGSSRKIEASGTCLVSRSAHQIWAGTGPCEAVKHVTTSCAPRKFASTCAVAQI